MKQEPIPSLYNKTPRYVMQTLGTEWGRDLIGKDLWSSIARYRAHDLMSQGFDVVIDDVRFENEASVVRELGGIVVAVTGRGGTEGLHVSESGVIEDFAINNTGSQSEFEDMVSYILHRSDWPDSVS